jgi:ABC-2 type transport system permease protein
MAMDSSDLALEITLDFERAFVREGKAAVGITVNAVNAQKAGIASTYAGGIVHDFNQAMIGHWSPLLSTAEMVASTGGNIQITYSNWYNPHLDYKSFIVPGILGEIVALIICFPTALNIVREREIGTIEQLNVTPIKKWQFILGKLLPFWMLSLVMMTVGLIAGWRVFRIPIEGDISLIFLYTLTFAPCAMGLGFLISNFAETQQQAMFSAWFFVLIFILMCGLFTPTDSMPVWAQWLNVLNPIHYFVDFMRLIMLKCAGFAAIRQNYFSVLTYAVVVNGLAVWTYRKRN